MIKNIYGDYIWISRLDDKFIREYKKEFFSKLKGSNKETITTDTWAGCNVTSSFFNEPFINNCSSLDFNMMFSNRCQKRWKDFL